MESNCTFGDCRLDVFACGLCTKHYTRQLRYGDAAYTKIPPTGSTPEERLHFYGWTEVPGPLDTPCWEWAGARNKRRGGYGNLKIAGRTELAHRVAYRTWVGPIPPGRLVRHKCDNKPCINPAHLETGTHQDNSDDAVARGRTRGLNGSANGNVKLDWDQVVAIREQHATGRHTQLALAQMYGVSQSCIGRIVRRESREDN